jgi:putative phosphoesterase
LATYEAVEVDMMNVGLIADTHDNMTKIVEAVSLFKANGVELVIHAGDFIAPFSVRPFSELGCKLIGVFGNNDGERIGLLKALEGFGELYAKIASIEVDGRKIVVMHEPEVVEALKASCVFDVIVYGHTHNPLMERYNGCLVINPGEACGWLTGKATVAVLDTETLEANIYEI